MIENLTSTGLKWKIYDDIKSDTEVSFYYLSYLIDKYKDADDAIKVFQKTIRGNFAFVIFIKKNNCFYVLKNGSPIAISNKNNYARNRCC